MRWKEALLNQELSSYVGGTLRKDEEFVLYRGKHPNQPGSAAVLVLAPASARPAVETLKRIQHEYSLRNELDTAWAVRSVALSEQSGQIVLVLEDPGGDPLDGLIHGPLDTGQFLRISLGLSRALSGLHKKGLIHKDIKPANILVNLATDEVRLMGFGITSRFPREHQAPEPPEFIEGTLPYMAPEQTGRMNRSIDSRSDLYALGVTLYEMLTGSLPFTASDPMEWVHCHIARHPTPPSERLKGVPAVVSAIIMKLLAKTAEERYQTAVGLERDLRHCLEEWETGHRIGEFRPGEQDIPDRLAIPEKLHGREREIEVLLAAFHRMVGEGRPELVLVSGYSGIGKSSLVNELHKSLVPPRGLFASGKFDQYKRDIPYATLAQAFQSLVRQLLSKSEGELTKWRGTLREALDPNGQLMVDLVPALKLVIGDQPPVPDLPQQEAQGRFHLVFRRFISVFARPEHPLALFLDDLQWLDAATLDLMEDLLTQPDVKYLLLIGAYRDNEVDSAHPLLRKLEAIRRTGATVQEILLAPLALEDVGLMIADSLRSERKDVLPLAHLIHEKTAGNPFFAIQFISALAEEGLIVLEHGEGRWSWDLACIRGKSYTDNVAELMVEKLNRLPSVTQNALQRLACLGNKADFTMLQMVFGESTHEMHEVLWEAVRAGLIFRSGDSYSFLHDRVQEAAYSLIPENLRAEAHLRIGRLLAAGIPAEKRRETIFEIVNQLNRGAALMTSRDEREQLAEFNLIAGKRAKSSTAYASALKYLIAGTTLLDAPWERHHELIFSLELHRAECEFLSGERTAAEQRLTELSSWAANVVELATVTCLRVDLYTALDQNDRAVAVCLSYLQRLSMECSPHPADVEVEREYAEIWSRLGSRNVEELIDLPLMSDPESLATLDVLIKVLPSALFTDANLLCLTICKAVNFSLERGNSDGSCVAYGWLGQIAGPHFANYKAGFRFGLLAYELVEKRDLTRFQARVYAVFGSHVMPWHKHVRSSRRLIQMTFEAALKIGDLSFAAYSNVNLNTNLLATGDPLEEVQREAERGLEFAQRTRLGFAVDVITVQLALVRTLRGSTRELGRFDDGQFEELQFERHLEIDPSLAQPECFYWIRKLQARFVAGDYSSALDAALRAQRLLWSIPSNLEAVDYHYYGALSITASWDSSSPSQKQRDLENLKAHLTQLETWAENCPENFENRAALVGAEVARIEGRVLDAEGLYEKAIHSAQANGLIHYEGVAYEIAARFYAARGFDKFADAYLQEAQYCYLRWGANGKVHQLDRLFPQLKKQAAAPDPTSTIVAPVELLDLNTVIKVSQAVSGEMVLGRLIGRVIRAAIEHAGAERGLLIVPLGDQLQIEAEATTSGNAVAVHMRNASAPRAELPESLVWYVARSHESVILDDASGADPFPDDPYIAQRRARSIVCLPLINQGKLTAILYLENNLTPNVFTPNRITVLKVLASQAATSLENTWLYRDLEQRLTEQKQAEAEIRALKDQLYRENLALREEIDQASMFEEIVGTSDSLRLVLSRIAKVAPTDSTVFITGETGTGKELIARALHKLSQRCGRAFVSVNCAALAPSLISSELFGHEKGAFTGATQRRLGRFELADGGTIFLDEVSELPPDTQVALLRVLQEREFERVGGTQSIKVDVRVIAATNRDLGVAVATGRFREDLFYRLNVFPIEVPPLRERRDDILMLVEYFVQRYAKRAGKNIRSIDRKTLDLLQAYDWPGNIRELQNVIERSVILSSGDVLSIDRLWLSKESSSRALPVEASKGSKGEGESWNEREIIEGALAESRGRVSGPSGAAAKLGIPPSTLDRRIKALKIDKGKFRFR